MMDLLTYRHTPTLHRFHASGAQMRCVVGPVGSGKSSAGAWELCEYLPAFLFKRYKIKHTKWCVVRNTYPELRDTTKRTFLEWFPDAIEHAQENTLIIERGDWKSEILFRSCDRPDDMRKFKSLEVTGFLVDESIEVPQAVKRMLKNRAGRFPRKCPVRFGIEITNPPDVEHPLYSEYAWESPPPGPIPSGKPLDNHVGFWQLPRENAVNLRPGYYEDLINDYRDNPDWIAMYIEGMPGMVIVGRQVYQKFVRAVHVAQEPLAWTGGPLYRGWDNTGNCPACVLAQVPTAGSLQVLREFWSDRDGIVDFSKRVVEECNILFPGGKYTDYGDPAGATKFSRSGGGLTSNAELMEEAAGIVVYPSEQNFTARQQAVESLLMRRDGFLLDPSCIRLTNGFLGGYNYPEIGQTGIFREDPLKNRFSHPHDALQYLAVKIFVSTPAGPPRVTHETLRRAGAVPIDFSRDRAHAWMG